MASEPGETPDPREEPGVVDEDAWRAIVENFGDRVVLDQPAEEPSPPARPEQRTEEPEALSGTLSGEQAEEHYVPPPPPPLPTPPPVRLLAWLGLFGVPSLVLVSMVAGVLFPSWVGLLLLAWFVGGFVYLVATMRPRDESGGHDDGAVV